MSSKDLESFASEEVLVDAVIRNLQIVGEAVRTLPEETRAMRSDIEWTRIVGLRHLLVHHYFGIDEEIVWDLAVNRSPELLAAVRDILQRLPDE